MTVQQQPKAPMSAAKSMSDPGADSEVVAHAQRRHIAQLTRERDSLKSRLDKALLVIDVQKKRAALLGTPIIAKRHSRPHVCDDNPYSASQFKTMKYRPDFPARFGCIEDARLHCQAFFAWYNTEHRHSGIGYMTPQAVHYGLAPALRELRQTALDTAFRASPRRFKGLRPTPGKLPTAVWINPPAPQIVTTQTPSPCTVNS